jgi:hypothetical protein
MGPDNAIQNHPKEQPASMAAPPSRGTWPKWKRWGTPNP